MQHPCTQWTIPPHSSQQRPKLPRSPSGRSVAFPKATPTFAKWPGEFGGKTYGRKTILDINGRPAFAELAILWTLQTAGWQGFWIDTFGHHLFRMGYWDGEAHKSLPQKPSSLSQDIWDLAKIRVGVWDVFCWQDDRVLFCESKRAKKDVIRGSQIRFAELALNSGFPLDSLLFVEWTTDEERKPNKGPSHGSVQ